jgi:hypothetical protein
MDSHLCIPTIDGNAHVVPEEVFTKIISEELKITDMDDWEIIIRTALKEWLKTLNCPHAAGQWQEPPAPKDGTWILGLFNGEPHVVMYDTWKTGGGAIYGPVSPVIKHKGWCPSGDTMRVMEQDEPEVWAYIYKQ